jgi:hypothetical protein
MAYQRNLGKATIMVSFVRFSRAILILSCMINTACDAKPKCPNFQNTYHIEKWKEEKPKRVEIQAFKKGGGFSEPIDQEVPYEAKITKESDDSYTLDLKPYEEKYAMAPVDRDYLIKIDGKARYKIFDIVSSERGNLGCPLRSIKVNSCSAKTGVAVWFEMSC